MSNDKVNAARPAALSKAGLAASKVGREQNSFHADGSVEFAFFSKLGSKRLLAHVLVAPNGSATVINS